MQCGQPYASNRTAMRPVALDPRTQMEHCALLRLPAVRFDDVRRRREAPALRGLIEVIDRPAANNRPRADQPSARAIELSQPEHFALHLCDRDFDIGSVVNRPRLKRSELCAS